MSRAKLINWLLLTSPLLLIGSCAAYCYGPPRFWGDFTGWSESGAVSRLGNPTYDSRNEPPFYIHEDHEKHDVERRDDYVPGAPFSLGWYHGVGNKLGLEFENGTVVRQFRGSK